MLIWQAVLGLLAGVLILVVSSEKAVNQLIKLAKIIGLSIFTIGFIVASIGSDLPEIMNSLISSYIGRGDITVGDSYGSVLTQISLILGLIPFFCTFCRLIPKTFKYVGIVEVGVLIMSILIVADGYVTRIDGLLLIVIWGVSVIILRKFAEQPVSFDKSIELEKPQEKLSRIIVLLFLGFIGIGIGSYVVIESAVTIGRFFGISEYLISFFLISLGTSLPELVVGVTAIDATLAIGIGPIFFPIEVSGGSVLVTGLYAAFVSAIVVSVLMWRGVNDKRTGGLFILLYLSSYLLLYLAS
jgi:cation:H+ antiporter